MRNIIICIATLLCVTNSLLSQKYYYWYKGTKISLELLSNKRYVLFASFPDTTTLQNNGIQLKQLTANNDSYSAQEEKVQSKTYYGIIESSSTNIDLSKQKDIIYEAPFFRLSGGAEAGISHTFSVKLKFAEDSTLLKRMANEYNVEVLFRDKYMPLWYTLACTQQSQGNTLQMANTFYESGLFTAAQPDLLIETIPHCLNDAYFTEQWALDNPYYENIDINYCLAQQITKGSEDVIIAVFDDGIDTIHPDIPSIHPESLDLYEATSGEDGSFIYGTHGTCCAGIIGATHNSIGIAGIAPNCPLMAISMPFGIARYQRADGFNHAWQHGASVISCSWSINYPDEKVTDAINEALTKGRNGLGCIIVASSGNSNEAVTYPANLPGVIAVGSIDKCGIRSGMIEAATQTCDPWPSDEIFSTINGSCYGETLDLAAPGTNVITTNGLTFSDSTYPEEYISFSGTSAACPHVAAVAGLILSVNPNLTAQEVANILESTAQKVGSYNYQPNQGHPNGTWHEEVGYGLVDAYAAVQAACPNENIYFTNQIVTSDTVITNPCGNINIQNVQVKNGAKLTLKATGKVHLGSNFHVELGSRFEITHP